MAASEIASPTSAGANPSARAAAAASAAWSGDPSKIVRLSRSTQASSPSRVPDARPTSLYWSSSSGRTTRGRSISAGVVPLALALDAVADRLPEQRVGVLGADQAEEVPGAVGQDGPVDLGVVLDGHEQVVERVVRPASARTAKVASAASMSLARTASRSASPPPRSAGRRRGGLDGVEDFPARSAVFLDAGGVAVEDLEDRQGAAGLRGVRRPCGRRGPGPSWCGSRRNPRRRTSGRWRARRRPAQSFSDVPPRSRSTTAPTSLSAGVSCISATSGSSAPKVSRSPPSSAVAKVGGEAEVRREGGAERGDERATAHVREESSTRAIFGHRDPPPRGRSPGRPPTPSLAGRPPHREWSEPARSPACTARRAWQQGFQGIRSEGCRSPSWEFGERVRGGCVPYPGHGHPKGR